MNASLMALLVSSLIATLDLGSAANQTKDCTTIVEGAQTPEAIPEYVIWEALFQDALSASGLLLNIDITPEHVTRVRAEADEVLRRTRGLRAAPIANREALAAADIVSSRDRLTRQLPRSTVAALQDAGFERARTTRFTVSAPGSIKVFNSGYVCSTQVEGEQYPHLIPEWIYWRAFFHQYRIVGDDHYISPFQFAPKIIQGLQSGSLRIATAHLQHVLQIARDTAKAADASEEAGRPGIDTARIVLDARANLLRTLPAAVWTTVNAEAYRTRLGVTFFFPPSAAVSGR